jgi:general secretion pathway protein D
MEVKVLRIDLSDGMDSAFDFSIMTGDGDSVFSGGEIVPVPDGGTLPGGTGFDARAGVFQVVSENFLARLRLLQTRDKVTALATPLILTANAEVSRIFSGEKVPIVVGFTEPQVIVSDGAQTTLPSTPVTELRDVGTDLLLTANINADRTVTLRLLQETSAVNRDGARILVPEGTSFANVTVDTVRTQSASGTIVAADGQMIAFGGLIEEGVSSSVEQLPFLGDIPLLGLLFRREGAGATRTELVILVRPYVLNTPAEGESISRDLLDDLSVHPYEYGEADLGVFDRDDGLAPGDRHSLIEAFDFFNDPEDATEPQQ